MIFCRFWTRGKGACKRIEHFDDPEAAKYSANHIVFSFQMPLPRDSKFYRLDFSSYSAIIFKPSVTVKKWNNYNLVIHYIYQKQQIVVKNIVKLEWQTAVKNYSFCKCYFCSGSVNCKCLGSKVVICM